MIDLPIGKALVAVLNDTQCKMECKNEDYICKVKNCCKGCALESHELGSYTDNEVCGCLACIPANREDEKHVIFKLVDYPITSVNK